MFFGTSAMTSLPCAAATYGTPSTTAAAAAIAIFFIDHSSLVDRPGRLPGLKLAELAQCHREYDEQTDESAFPVRVYAGEQQTVADDLDQGRADEGSIGSACAAHQIRPADHRRGNRPQLIARPHRIDGCALIAHEQHGGDAREQT